MHADSLPRPAVTVASIVARDGAFLCVEEETRAGLRLNQPAGHVELGESLVEAAARETLEETGYVVVPSALVRIYRWQPGPGAPMYIRFAFEAAVRAHDPARPLDRGIVRADWFDYATLAARRAQHRSPMVMRCIDDYLSGRRLPLSVLTDVLP